MSTDRIDHVEPNDVYYARRAAQERLRAEATCEARARQAHQGLARAYEREAMRAMLDKHLG
jgi:hypothetical protein